MVFRNGEVSAMVSEISDLRYYRSRGNIFPTDDLDAHPRGFALDVRSPSLDSSICCDFLVLSGPCPHRDLSTGAIALEVGRLPRPP